MKKGSNKGFKKLVLLLLLFVGLGASVTAGAYWASSVTVSNPTEANGTVNVKVGTGQAVTVTTTLSAATAVAGDTKVLVPTGFINDANTETASKSFTVTASWTMSPTAGVSLDDVLTTRTITAGTPVVTAPAVAGWTAADSALFTVIVTPASPGSIELGGTNEITVTVTMSEPADANQYARVANADITITFTLNIA